MLTIKRRYTDRKLYLYSGLAVAICSAGALAAFVGVNSIHERAVVSVKPAVANSPNTDESKKEDQPTSATPSVSKVGSASTASALSTPTQASTTVSASPQPTPVATPEPSPSPSVEPSPTPTPTPSPDPIPEEPAN